ncbi:MAG: cytochrome C oxidase subunit II [Solirubrobacterales bacterium]
MQDIAWYASIFPFFLVVLSFGFVLSRSRQLAQVPVGGQERLRRSLFFGALILGTPLAVHTMADLPYQKPDTWSGPSLKIEAVGRQWSWDLTRTDIKVGEQVEFYVTSADVNHGFAIYSPSMRVVAQTQAMPGYINILRHTFREPGTYTVMCLEYCGQAHHAMAAELHVSP